MSGIYGPHLLLDSKSYQWVGAKISCLPPIIVLFFAVISAFRILSPEEKSLKSKKPILPKLIQERTLNECRIFEGYVPFNILRHFKFQYEELHQNANQLFVVGSVEETVAELYIRMLTNSRTVILLARSLC